MNSKVRRINWVSEIQNTAGRRAVLVATYPAFILYGVVASLFKCALYVVVVVLVGPAASIVRYTRILTYSARLRWRHAKPRGKADWVVAAVDAYVDRLDAPKVETWTAWEPTDAQ